MEQEWNTQRQLGELVGELRGMRTGQSVRLPNGVKIGVVVVGKRGGARQRSFAVVTGNNREYKRSATEAAVSGMNLSRAQRPQEDAE